MMLRNCVKTSIANKRQTTYRTRCTTMLCYDFSTQMTIFRRRHAHRAIIVLVVLCLLMLARGPVSDLQGPCNVTFRLSDAAYPWEKRSPDSGCVSSCLGDPGGPSFEAGLRRTKALLGRPPSVVFVGDSRVCELHVSTVRVCDRPEVPLPPRNTSPAALARLSIDSPPEQWCELGMCPQNVTYDVIETRLVWRPYLNGYMKSALEALADGCRRGVACPDAVVVNGGMWYGYRVPFAPNWRKREAFVTRFREGLLKVMPALGELTRLTRTIWKLEEGCYSEFVWDDWNPNFQKSENNQLLMVQHAVVYDISLQNENLVIWSSLLPEATRHMFHVCARTKPRRWPECPDAIHMGRSLQTRLATQILEDVCTRARRNA